MIFVSTQDIVRFLQSDPDHYYDTFTRYDLLARRVSSVPEYVDRIKYAIVEASPDLKLRIQEATEIVDAYLQTIQRIGFNGKKAAKLSWRFGFMKGRKYEDGLPHTRLNIIMLPTSLLKASKDELVETLLHEKVHIYQKAYPDDVRHYLQNIVRLRPRSKRSRIRANPDTDGWIYRDSDRVYKCLYLNSPLHIEDVTGEYEHPFEMIDKILGK